MSVEGPTLGDCPRCGEAIPRGNVLIEYDGGVFAECGGCGEPVAPE